MMKLHSFGKIQRKSD